MTVEQIAFRALLYRELHDQRYTDSDDLGEHYEEMRCELPPGLAVIFAHTLPPEDWAVVRVMDQLSNDLQQAGPAVELLYAYDSARLEAMLHALGVQPQLTSRFGVDVLARWHDVRAAMRSFGFWALRADDLPHDAQGWREQPGGEELAVHLRELLKEWPASGEDPAQSARQFERALARALTTVSDGDRASRATR